MTLPHILREGPILALGRSHGRNGHSHTGLGPVIDLDADGGTQTSATGLSGQDRVPARRLQGAIPNAGATTSKVVHDGTTFEHQLAKVDGRVPPHAQPAPRPLDSLDHQHHPTAATPLQGEIALSTEDVDGRLGHLLVKEQREYGGLRNGFHLLRTHHPQRLEIFIATMINIAAGVGTGGNISVCDPRPVAEDVLILACVLLSRYLAVLADEGKLSSNNDDVLPAVFFLSASKLVGAGAETTAAEVLAACNVRDPEQVTLLKKRMNTLEFEVGSKLGWMLNAATPTEFIHLFLSRAESTSTLEQSCSARERATTMVFDWTRRGLLADFKPSELASAAVYHAVLCEQGPTTARTVSEVDGSGIPDLVENARFSVLVHDTERGSAQPYRPSSMMEQTVETSHGVDAGQLKDGGYDTEELTPPSTAGWASTRHVSFFQDDEVPSNDNTSLYSFQPDFGIGSSDGSPGRWSFIVDQNNNRARIGNFAGTGGRSDGTSTMMLDAEAPPTPVAQGISEEEGSIPLLNQTAGDWFGSSLFLPSAMTGLAAGIEDAAVAPGVGENNSLFFSSAMTGLATGIEDAVIASGPVDSVYYPVTPSTRRVDSNAGFGDGQKDVESDEKLVGWAKGFLHSVAQEDSAGPGAGAKTRPPIGLITSKDCKRVDGDACGGNVGDEITLGQVCAGGTTPHSDNSNRSINSAPIDNDRSLPQQHGPLLVPPAVVVGRSSRGEARQPDPIPLQSESDARWERAALRRLDEGVEAYRRQQQELSMVRWGPGGLLVPVSQGA